jgi:apolipoprotein N-acyltransferase
MKSILLAFLSGLLLILCFPRFDIEYLAWFAMVPLFIAIKDKSLKSAFGLCFFTGTIFYIGVFYFFKLIKGVSWIEFVLVGMLLLSCYYGLFGLGLNFVSKKTRLPLIIVAPVLWVTPLLLHP